MVLAVLTIEASILMSGISIAIVIAGRWLSGELKKTSDTISNTAQIKQNKDLVDLEIKGIRENHTELKRRFDEHERDCKKDHKTEH